MSEGPFAGSRCLACVEGPWKPATIRKAYADGTFRIELDEKSMRVLPYWYGVTRAELRFNDLAMWPACREALALPDRFGVAEFARFVELHSPGVPVDVVASLWGELVETALRMYHAGLGDGRGVDRRDVSTVHPCNPSLLRPTQATYRGLRARGLDGELGAAILEHHDFEWVAVFDPGEIDARVYVHQPNDPDEEVDDSETIWRKASPSVGFFFWDVVQSGLGWWTEQQRTEHRPDRPPRQRVRETDVGFAIVR